MFVVVYNSRNDMIECFAHIKRIVFVISIIICGSVLMPAKAQNAFQDTYDKFRQQAKSEYEDFRKKANQEYADWMRKAWEWHDKIEPMPRPKDEMLPPVIYNKDQQQEESKPMPYDEVVPMPEPNPQPKPVAPIREEEGGDKKISFQFFGTDGQVRLPNNFSFKLKGKDEDAYAEAWEELSSEQYDNLIRDCLVLRMEHHLCDWAYLMMLGAMSESICGESTNEATMLQACQSGYKTRLGFTAKKDLCLLFKSEHQIFDLEGFEMEDGVFYLLHPIEEDGLNICDISFPEEKPLSLWITQEQQFTERISKERLLIPEDSLIAIKCQVNENLLDFYSTYPTSMIGDDIVSRWAMYARTPLSESVKDKLYPQLKAVLNRANDAVMASSWLLYWVQTAFVYEYDD